MIEFKTSVSICYLCSCAINRSLPSQDAIASMNLDELYRTASNHMIAALIGITLKDAGTLAPQFEQAIAVAQRKTIILYNEFTQVSKELENAHIWYLPLKGIILKDYYPVFAMREMADCDMLVDADRVEDIKNIMEGFGYQTKSFGVSVHDVYIKPPVTEFEMHKALFSFQHDKSLQDYYSDIKSRLILSDGARYQYHFTKNDFYLFMIAHAYRHFVSGGIGLRLLLDTYVYLLNNDIDFSYIDVETQKMGISDFERNTRELSLKLFKTENLNNILNNFNAINLNSREQQMLDYIFSSGAYGTLDHSVENKVDSVGGKIKYINRRIFGPLRKNDPFYDDFKKRYSFFFKYPILLPFLPFYRLIRAFKNRPKHLKAEVNALKSAGKTRKD